MSNLDLVFSSSTNEVLLEQARNRVALKIEREVPLVRRKLLWESDALDKHRKRFGNNHCYEVQF